MSKVFLIPLLLLSQSLCAEMEFNGLNTYVNIAAFTGPASGFTVSAWVYKNSAGQDMIIIHGNGAGADGFYMNVFSNTLSINVSNAGNLDQAIDPSTFPQNVWVNVAGTYDKPTTTLTLYRDGVQIAQNVAASHYDVPTNSPTFGAYNLGGVGQPFHGMIDDVRYYDHALTAQEISSLSKSHSRLNKTGGAVAYWRTDDGQEGVVGSGSNTVRDYSGKGHHGTPTNGPIFRASSLLNYP